MAGDEEARVLWRVMIALLRARATGSWFHRDLWGEADVRHRSITV